MNTHTLRYNNITKRKGDKSPNIKGDRTPNSKGGRTPNSKGDKSPNIKGEGTFGCVVEPELPCKKVIHRTMASSNTKTRKVSKIMNKYDAIHEMDEYDIIQKIDPSYRYFLSPPTQCTLYPTNDSISIIQKCKNKSFKKNTKKQVEMEELQMLVMLDAGQSLRQIENAFLQNDYSLQKKKDIAIHFWKYAVPELLSAILLLQKNRYLHHDLKSENITYDIDSGKIHIIDYGKMVSFKKEILKCTRSLSNKVGRPVMLPHWSYPPDMFLFFGKKMRTKKIQNEIAENIRSGAEYIVKDTDNLRELTRKYIEQINDLISNYISVLTPNTTFDEETVLQMCNYHSNYTIDKNYLLARYLQTFDIYGLGFGLATMYSVTHTYLQDELNVDALYVCCEKMLSPSFLIRPTIWELIDEYSQIIA